MRPVTGICSRLRVPLLVIKLVVLGGCGAVQQSPSHLAAGWDPSNNPAIFEPGYEYRLSALPLSGQTSHIPWPDTYWPDQYGGIADRWQTSEDTFSYKTYNDPAKLNQEQLALLSPAEKFDLLRGRYDFPLVGSERRRTNPESALWRGICHGLAPLSMAIREPQPTVVKNARGIEIPFGASDIKALLVYNQALMANVAPRVLGQRCNDDLSRYPDRSQNPACEDVNAGAFHLVITNRVGIRKVAVITDLARDLQVWNQPIYSYRAAIGRSTPPRLGAAPGTVEEKVISMQVRYSVSVDPSWSAQDTSGGRGYDERNYQYTVELDNAGRIIGGRWLGDGRPDFMWVQPPANLSGDWQLLAQFYRSAVKTQNP
ncbi:MAG: hypothetical protein FJ146_11105 [Deltaproteobacteria bacterium]|nr:hypothetical protein [Deltaproteobacteria bacterium]